MGEEMPTKDPETTAKPKNEWLRRERKEITEEDIQKNIQKLKQEQEERLKKVKLQEERENKFRQLQVELMQQNQSGINFIESQTQSLKLLIAYIKELNYRLPIHMDLKPYSIIVKELIETVSKIWSAKYMDEQWIKKYGHELGILKGEIDGAIKMVKARKKYMVYL